MPIFDPNVPTGFINLDTDYKNLQNNNMALDTVFGEDHTLFSNSTPEAGYHKTVHLIPQTTPGTIAGYGQMYAKTIADGFATSPAFFYRNDTNTEVQMSRNFNIINSTIGASWIFGGIMQQWGFVNGTHGSNPKNFQNGDTNTVTFPKPFQVACFAVFTQAAYTPASAVPPGSVPSSSTQIIISNNLTKTGFVWNFLSNSSDYTRFYWFAVGN